MEYDAYLEMANAVVQQACEDYVNSQLKLMGIKKKFNEKTGKYEYKRRKYDLNKDTVINLRYLVRDCVVFFKTDWCERLSPNYNGQELINLLNDRVKNDVAEFEKQEAERQRKREEEKLRKQKEAERKKVEKKVKEKKLEVKEPERVITQEDIEKTLGSFTYEEIV